MGSTLTYESEPWVECELCHEITDVEGKSEAVTFEMLDDFIGRTLNESGAMLDNLVCCDETIKLRYEIG